MTTLEDRLAALADDAPVLASEPGLWERGLSLHRRRRRGTVAIVAVVVLALGALGTASSLRSRPALPAAPSQGMMLPDRFYDPSERLPSTADEGPLGPLSAVVLNPTRVAGVAATTGEYRYLELPGVTGPEGLLGPDGFSLSADGERLAYWLMDDGAVEAIAVYDTKSGDIERYDIASPHGLLPFGMVWAGDVLWFSYGFFDTAEQSSTHGSATVAWDPESGDDRTWSGARQPELGNATGSSRALVEIVGRQVTFWTMGEGRGASFRTTRLVEGEAFLNHGGDRLAGVADPDGSGASDTVNRPILLLSRGRAGQLAAEPVMGFQGFALLGWRDDDHVVAQALRSPGYWMVDVETGDAEQIVEGDESVPLTVEVAQDAWAAPIFEAPEPPHPLSPWLVWGGSGVALLLGALVLVWWRRRVRP